MAHTLAMEWAQYGIRVNSVSPGLVKTAMTYWVPQQPDWEQQLKYYGGIPRLAEVGELGGVYVNLFTDMCVSLLEFRCPITWFRYFPSMLAPGSNCTEGLEPKCMHYPHRRNRH